MLGSFELKALIPSAVYE